MTDYSYIATQPVFFLFIAFSFFVTLAYFRGRRRNKKISTDALNEIVNIIKPDDHLYTNIGGAIGYHANMTINNKGSLLSRVEATITLLPRHSLLYLPISMLIRKYDRLFITMHLRRTPMEELHIIEKKYRKFSGARIVNVAKLKNEEIKWGKFVFFLYYKSSAGIAVLKKFIAENPDPANVRHIALVPEQKRGFVFMIPRKGAVETSLAAIYKWLPSTLKD